MSWQNAASSPASYTAAGYDALESIIQLCVTAPASTPAIAPTASVDVDELINEWSGSPEMAAHLASARADFGAMLTEHGQKGLKTLRLSRGLSQADLAAALGTSQAHISRLESSPNTADIRLETVRRLSEYFGLSLDDVNSLLLSQSSQRESQ